MLRMMFANNRCPNTPHNVEHEWTQGCYASKCKKKPDEAAIAREALEKRVKDFLFGEWIETTDEYDEVQAIADFVEKEIGNGGKR